ncbi:MAG: TetR/AcrR family transcriptional regulator [Pseudomonadota bacterium]
MVAEPKTDPEKADAIREEIVSRASELFSHYGFWKTNIGDIADCCGMSPGNLYRYFRNKQAIGVAVVSCYFDMLQAAFLTVEMLPGGTAEERVRKWLEAGVTQAIVQVSNHPKIVELAEFLMEDEDGLALLQSHIQWKRTHLGREIQKGMDDGSLAPGDPVEIAGTLLTALKVFWMPTTLAKWRDKSAILPEVHAILDLFFRGLRARA